VHGYIEVGKRFLGGFYLRYNKYRTALESAGRSFCCDG